MKQFRQLLGLALALLVLAAAAVVLLFKPADTPAETTLVLSQTAIALPGDAGFDDGRFTVQLLGIPGDTGQVRVRVMGPDGVVDEWDQGMERKSYRYEARRYFVDVLSIMDDETQVTDATVSVSREL